MYVFKWNGPLLPFSVLCDIFREKNFFENFKVFFQKMVCAFWALDIAPTLDVPVLFTFKTLPTKPDETKGPSFQFCRRWDFFEICLSPKGPSFEASPRNIRIEALYPNFWRYIRTISRFIEEAEVWKQEFFMETSHAYFENCAFWALDTAPTLDVPVLFFFSRPQTSHWKVHVFTDFL